MSQPRLTLSQIDRWITILRRSVWGELAFIAVVTCGVLQFVRCAAGAMTSPAPVAFEAFVENARTWLGGEPYIAARDPNAPHVIAFFAPFVGMPLHVAIAVWLSVSTVLAGLSLELIRATTGTILSRQVTALVIGLFLAAPATGDMVADGNMIWALWLPFTVAWSWERRGRRLASGLLIGALMTAKPFMAFWLLYFVVRQNWRGFASAIAGAIVAVAVGVAITGQAAWWAWVDVLGRITWHGGPNNAGVAGVIARTAGMDMIVWLACAVPFAAVTAWRWRRESPQVDRDWTLAVIAALLIAPLGWRYYFCWAIGPLTGWLRQSPPSRWLGSLLLLWAFTPILAPSSSSPGIAATAGSTVFWSTFAIWLALCFRREEHCQAGDQRAAWVASSPGSLISAGKQQR